MRIVAQATKNAINTFLEISYGSASGSAGIEFIIGPFIIAFLMIAFLLMIIIGIGKLLGAGSQSIRDR